MKLWELEANCLKLVFADSDMNFDEADFGIVFDSENEYTIQENPPVLINSNTKQYLVRITDSIRRAIDLYREICGRDLSTFESSLFVAKYDANGNEVTENEASKQTLNKILIPKNLNIEKIKRVKVYNLRSGNLFDDNVDFKIVNDYSLGSKRQFISLTQDYSRFEDIYNERIWKFEIEFDLEYPYVDTTTSFMADLEDFDLPQPVQNMIPVFVKGEIYEEDEPQLALNAKNEYMSFLQKYTKNKTNSQKRVKPAKVFTKR